MRIAIAALLLTGCTLVSDLDSQDCKTDLDCGAGRVCSANNLCLLTSGAAACTDTDQCADGELCAEGKCKAEEAARWGCVANMSEAPVSGSSKVTLQIQLATRKGSGALPASMVSAVACTQPKCDDAVGPFLSSDKGVVSVMVNQGFEGFIKLTGDGLLDTYYQLQAPLNAAPSAQAQVTMLRAADVSSIAMAAGAEIKPSERGVVLFQVLDCVGDLSADVSVANLTADAELDLLYLGADQNADPAASATSAAGVAMALDSPVGAPEFELTRQSSGDGLAMLTVATVAGAVTYVPYQFGR